MPAAPPQEGAPPAFRRSFVAGRRHESEPFRARHAQAQCQPPSVSASLVGELEIAWVGRTCILHNSTLPISVPLEAVACCRPIVFLAAFAVVEIGDGVFVK